VPFQINRPIFAAPDLVGAKTWPVNPSFADDNLRLVYDVTPEVLAGRQVAATYLGFSIAALGNFQTTVPVDEAWWCYRMSFHSGVLAAGNSLAVALWYSVRSPTQGLCAIYSPPSRTATVGEQLIHSYEVGCWMQPGSFWGLNANVFAGAAIAGNVHAHVVPVKL